MTEIEVLRKKIKELEDRASLVIKEGTILYINKPEWPSEKFGKIDVGIDCTEILNGKEFKDYLSFQIGDKSKTLFAAFDRTEGKTPEFKVGDRIKVCCSVGTYQPAVEKKEGRSGWPIIYNNVTLMNVKMVEAADAPPATKNEASEPEVIDDMPF